jgi:hypothetical protein
LQNTKNESGSDRMSEDHGGKKRRFHIVLSLDNPVQQETWSILSQSKNKTSAVCEAVCGFHRQKSLEDILRKVLREEFKHIPIQSTAEMVEEPDTFNDAAVLDFLLTLQNE